VLSGIFSIFNMKSLPALMPYDDNDLAIRLRANDTAAFEALYEKYHQALYAYIRKFIKVPELSEDILQEVFLKIWEVRHRLNPTLSLQAYIYRIARNAVFKTLKRIAIEEDLQVAIAYQLAENAESVDLQLQWRQYDEILQEAIKQLPPQRQKVFRLCRQEGKKYEEVGMELNLSRNTVKEHMVLATRFLREYIYTHYKVDFILILMFLLFPDRKG
jgi:RNA polymerase sigma-70 factor (family 1)